MKSQTITAIVSKLGFVCCIAYSSIVMAADALGDDFCSRHCEESGACGSIMFTDEETNTNHLCSCEAACSSPQEFGPVQP